MLRIAAACVVVFLATTISGVAEEDFPILGAYTRDIACKGNGAAQVDVLVTITREQIESPMGICRIINRKRDGKAISAHVECKVPGADQPILGDVMFTIRDDKTLKFEDQDHTSDAILHKCAG